MVKKIILLLMIILSTVTLGEEKYFKGKVLTLESIQRPEEGEESEIVKEIQLFKVKILEGEDKDKELLIEHPVFKEESNNIEIFPNNKVVILKDTSDGEEYYIIDNDKRGWLLGVFGIFLGLTIVIAKWRGVKAILALGITCYSIVKFLIPLIIKGYSPIILSIIVGIFACVVTISLMTDFTPKGFSAFLGSIVGVLSSGLLSYLYTNAMGLTGYSDTDIITMAQMLKGINLKELISAGVILGSMGAVMDVGMSIASALNELKMRDGTITKRELFTSGINIGSDVIGTMVNTLILAYTGSSLITMLLLIIQGADYPLIRILNFEFISVEIMRAFCGSIGILVTVPATAYISSILYSKK